MSKAKEIINAIPCREGTRKHAEILGHILTAISGGKVYFNKCWRRSKGYTNLIRTPNAYEAFMALKNSGVVAVECGNDAPRGGATGDYFTAHAHGNIVNALDTYKLMLHFFDKKKIY